MEHDSFYEVFPRRLMYYMNKFDMTQADLAKRLNVGTTSVYNWCNGIKSPRMDKVDRMCEIFNCRRSDLMEATREESFEEFNYISKELVKDRAMTSALVKYFSMPQEMRKTIVDVIIHMGG